MKTYEFKGKKVITVPEKDRHSLCEGCMYYTGFPWPDECKDSEQEKAGVPNCIEEKIIFQLAPDEKQD